MTTEIEMQSRLVVAKKFPRDEIEALGKIRIACSRLSLASVAIYKYPRGGASVSGPSIRLAEVIAQYWGNLICNVREVEKREGESVMEAFCLDLETNYSKNSTWTVGHHNGKKMLTDGRDIYEKNASEGSRRLRACMLAVIPTDIVDEAMNMCRKTLANGGKDKPIKDRIRDMVSAFQSVGVSRQMIEGRISHGVDIMDVEELGELREIYTSIKDNMSKKEDWFQGQQINELIGV
jgi:hypothetical protein